MTIHHFKIKKIERDRPCLTVAVENGTEVVSK